MAVQSHRAAFVNETLIAPTALVADTNDTLHTELPIKIARQSSIR